MASPPVVLLHGFLGCAEDFAGMIIRSAHVLALDLPGHGADPEPVHTETFDAAVEQVRAQLAARGITRCHLLGYSMGGRIAVALATHAPELVASVIAVGASAGIADEADRSRRRDADARLAVELEGCDQNAFRAFLARWYDQDLFAPLRGDPRFDAILERRCHGHPGHLAAALRAMGVGGQPPLHHELAASETPILWIAGALDAKYVDLGAQLANVCPRGTFRTVPGAGHSVHLEKQTELSRVVAGWLAEHEEQNDDD